MRLVSNQNLSSIPWTVVLHGPIEGEAFLCGFAEAAPRQRLRLLALGVTPLGGPSRLGERTIVHLQVGFTRKDLLVQFSTTVSFVESSF